MARKIQAQRAAEQLDKQIEQLYYKHANCRQINIMDIPKLYNFAKSEAATGKPLEDAVKAAIEKFCGPASA